MLWQLIVLALLAVTSCLASSTTKKPQQTSVDIHNVMVYGASKLGIDSDLLEGKVNQSSSNSASYYDSFTVDKLIEEYLKTVEDETVMTRLHTQFQKLYSKVYASEAHQQYGRDLLQNRLKMVLENNIKAVFGQSTYVLAINVGSDLPLEDIMKQAPAGNWPQAGQLYQAIAHQPQSYANSFVYAPYNQQKEAQAVARSAKWHAVEPHNNEEAMRHALEQHGPLAVTLAFNDALAHYHSGVFAGECPGGRNYAVLLVVGYGHDATTGGHDADYWILKNQWGETYGEHGYFRLKRNANNLCDIAGDAVWVE